MWDPVKIQRKGYTPKRTKLKRQGQQVHDRMRAETFAYYYGYEHWAEDIVDRPELQTHQYILLTKKLEQATLTHNNLKKQ